MLINTIRYINFTYNISYGIFVVWKRVNWRRKDERPMSDVRRVYAEKKPEFAVQAKELQQEIKSYLGITGVTGVRILIRYDVENISEEVFERACTCVFSEPPVEDVYKRQILWRS